MEEAADRPFPYTMLFRDSGGKGKTPLLQRLLEQAHRNAGGEQDLLRDLSVDAEWRLTQLQQNDSSAARPNQGRLSALNENAVAFYREQLDQRETELPAHHQRLVDTDWQALALCYLEHLCWLDPHQARRWFYPHYLEALAYCPAFATCLLALLDTWKPYMGPRYSRCFEKLRKAASVNAGTRQIQERIHLFKRWRQAGKILAGRGATAEQTVIYYWLLGMDHLRLGQATSARKSLRRADGGGAVIRNLVKTTARSLTAHSEQIWNR